MASKYIRQFPSAYDWGTEGAFDCTRVNGKVSPPADWIHCEAATFVTLEDGSGEQVQIQFPVGVTRLCGGIRKIIEAQDQITIGTGRGPVPRGPTGRRGYSGPSVVPHDTVITPAGGASLTPGLGKLYLCDPTTADVPIALPDPTEGAVALQNNGKRLVFKNKTNTTAHGIVLTAAEGQQIEFQASVTYSGAYVAIDLVWNEHAGSWVRV